MLFDVKGIKTMAEMMMIGKMRRMKRVNIGGLIIMIALLLPGCSNAYSEGPVESKNDETVNSQFEKYVYDQERAQILSYNSQMAISDKGYYYIANNILNFYNVESEINSPMCSRVDCEHKDSKCDAYVYSSSATGEFACNCMDERLHYYEDYLYLIERSTDSEFYLCRYNNNFNDREVITKLASFEDERTMVMNANISVIQNGYLYYYASIVDQDYAQKDYMATFLCKRVKLEKDAIPEILGEFEFPGDYAMKVGDSNGLGILVTGDNIYFVAGGTARYYTTNNPVQYRVSGYNRVSGAFECIWSYEGNENEDIFGADTGAVTSFSGGDRMYIDENGYIYLITSSNGVRKNIIGFDAFNVSVEIIYTTEHDELQDIYFNGEYFCFLETDVGKASYLTIMDKEGQVKVSRELEYTEEYLTMFESYKEQFPEDNGIMPVADYHNVIICGMDERYILLESYQYADVFKGMTSTDITTPHGAGKDTFFEGDLIMGIGVFSWEELISGNQTNIKQIYKYEP